MDMTNKEYKDYVERKSPKSSLLKDMLLAYLFGGLICIVGEGLFDWIHYLGMGEQSAKTLTTIILVFLGAAFTAIGVYDKLANYAGAGTIVPITGFANAMASPAMEFKSEGIVVGVGAKMFSIVGGVILYGVSASIIYGLIYYFIR